MKYSIHNAVVIGSGTMGAAIAAHLANAGVRVTLLDIVPKELTQDEKDKGLGLKDNKVRNRIVNQGLQTALKSRPASFYSQNLSSSVTIGNLEDDFEVIKSADWVIEVIIENLKIKQELMSRIDQIRSEKTIISTNTSGIPVTTIAEGCSKIKDLQDRYTKENGLPKVVSQPFVSKNVSQLMKLELIEETWIDGLKKFYLTNRGKLYTSPDSIIRLKEKIQDSGTFSRYKENDTSELVQKIVILFMNNKTKEIIPLIEELLSRNNITEEKVLLLVEKLLKLTG